VTSKKSTPPAFRRRTMFVSLASIVALSAASAAGAGAVPALGAATLPSFVGQVAVGQNLDGRLELFAAGTDGVLYHRRQLTPNGAWSSWMDSGHDIQSPTVAANADGRLEMFALRAGRVVNRSQNVDGSWSSLSEWGSDAAFPPAVVRDGSGRLHVFVVRTDKSMWTRWQDRANSGPWTPWIPMSSGVFDGAPSAGRHVDGRVVVFARAETHSIWHRSQKKGTAGWTDWESFGGDFGSPAPAVAANQDGRLEVFAIGADGAAHHRWQIGTDQWSDWASEGGAFLKTLPATLGTHADGRLQVFALSTRFSVHTKIESQANTGPWLGWSNLGVPVGGAGTANRGAPVVIRHLDGTMQLFAIGNGRVCTSRQSRPGGAWSAWTAL
jgi:hypothetical protein